MKQLHSIHWIQVSRQHLVFLRGRMGQVSFIVSLTSCIMVGVHIRCSGWPVHCTRHLCKFEQKQLIQLRKKGGWKCDQDQIVSSMLTFYSSTDCASLPCKDLVKMVKSCKSLVCFLSLEEFFSKFQNLTLQKNRQLTHSLRTQFNWY